MEEPLIDYEYITEDRFVSSAVAEISKFPVRGWDTETYNLILGRMNALDPLKGAQTRLSQFALPNGRVFIFDLLKVKPDFHASIFPSRALTVGHNLKFDTKFLIFWFSILDFGPLFDTMLAAKILAEGEVTGAARFGLKHVASRYLNKVVSKEEQVSDWSEDNLSESQLQYAAEDSMILLDLHRVMMPEIKRLGLIRTCELDCSILPAVAEMELNGFRLDKDRWATQYEKLRLEMQTIENELWDELGNKDQVMRGPKGRSGKKIGLSTPLFNEGISTIKLSSQESVIRAMQDKGIQVPLNDDNKPCLKGFKLKNLAKEWPIIDKYLKYKGIEKKLSSYGINWIDLVNPVTGNIHAEFITIGAETGRFSARKPNMQQIPREDAYRNCFLAEPGCVLIAVDFSQCELRILTEYCLDENLLKAYDEGLDLHQDTAHYLFSVNFEDVDSKQRSIAKNQNFRIVYGGGPRGLAEAVQISLDDATAIVEKYLKEVYPGMDKWLKNQARATVRKMKARTMIGRSRKYWGDVHNDPKARGQVERNGTNLPVQGTSVDITKRATYLFRELVKDTREIKIVNIVHDEIIVTAPPRIAMIAAWALKTAMIMAEEEFLKRVPCVVDVNISTRWMKDISPEEKERTDKLLGGYKYEIHDKTQGN